MTQQSTPGDYAYSNRNLVIRRAKTIAKVRCKCGAVIHKGEVSCATCYDIELRASAGLPEPCPRFLEEPLNRPLAY